MKYIIVVVVSILSLAAQANEGARYKVKPAHELDVLSQMEDIYSDYVPAGGEFELCLNQKNQLKNEVTPPGRDFPKVYSPQKS